ncbi:hypothetical protein K432DRAFT_394275 [Lepidopterella palustris CBS 459.81]|uniref:Ankyrin n=1 Tax=Lepidopterella palustris CBS 459.81 TaxID=1314670 RepID=A0A8E2E8C9_9PEZI|nr:hypothetical protein K432DRAFT_394275 [Lepidopterella palustris CBS 459.81]
MASRLVINATFDLVDALLECVFLDIARSIHVDNSIDFPASVQENAASTDFHCKRLLALTATATDFNNNTLTMKLPLDTGADVNDQRGLYGSALQAAAYHNFHHVKMLIEHGAGVNQKVAGSKVHY